MDINCRDFLKLSVAGVSTAVALSFLTGGMAKGDSGNILTPHVGDANTTIPEYKTFLCNVRRAQDG